MSQILVKSNSVSTNVDFESSILVDGVTRVFPGPTPVEALRNVCFEVQSGSMIALVGPSGCGKTTILKIIAGLDQPTNGSVVVGGSSPEIARKAGKFGFSFQHPALVPWRNVVENISLPLEILRQQNKGKVTELIKLTRLEGYEKLAPFQLSGGMAQRVALARALVTQPQYLLLDEPFASLDWLLRQKLVIDFARIRLHLQPTSVLVTHEIREAAFLADRIVVMSGRPGTVLETVPVEFPRPRSEELLISPEFLLFCSQIESIYKPYYD